MQIMLHSCPTVTISCKIYICVLYFPPTEQVNEIMARTSSSRPVTRDDSDGSDEQKYGKTRNPVPCKLYALILKGLEYQAKRDKARDNGKQEETIQKLDGEASKYFERCIRRVKKNATCQENSDVREVDFRDELGRTLLHILCEENAPAVLVKEVLKANPNNCQVIFAVDEQLPLHKACGFKPKIGGVPPTPEFFRRKEELVRTLMEAYPPGILAQEDEGETPLHLLLEWTKNKALVKRMVDLANQVRSNKNILQIKDKEEQLPLHIAVDHESSTDVISYLLSQYRDGLKEQTIHGATCLHLAVFHKRLELIKSFSRLHPVALMTKVDEKYANNGGTPLHFLFKEHPQLPRDQHERILRYMIQPFSESHPQLIPRVIDKMDSKNKSVIEIAKTNRVHKAICKLLQDLKKGKIPNWETSGGRTHKKRQRSKKNHRSRSRSSSNDDKSHSVKNEPEESQPIPPAAPAPTLREELDVIPEDDMDLDVDISSLLEPQATLRDDTQMEASNEVQPPIDQMRAVHLSAQNQQDRVEEMSLAAASLSSYLPQNLHQKNIAIKQE